MLLLLLIFLCLYLWPYIYYFGQNTGAHIHIHHLQAYKYTGNKNTHSTHISYSNTLGQHFTTLTTTNKKILLFFYFCFISSYLSIFVFFFFLLCDDIFAFDFCTFCTLHTICRRFVAYCTRFFSLCAFLLEIFTLILIDYNSSIRKFKFFITYYLLILYFSFS